jgi:integrase
MSSSPSFEKVGECLYRNPSSRKYYALLKVRGKQIKRSLGTDNLPTARRKLKDFKREQERIDPDAGRISVEELCGRYLTTITHQAPKTVRRKVDIVRRIKERWERVSGAKVKKSEVLAWLSSFDFGGVSYNLHLETIRAIFRLAVDDRILAASPVDGIKQRKRSRPIRLTPSLEEFRAIVASIREQNYADTAEESADFIEFLGLAGLGKAEASALTWADVDFKRGQLFTFRQKTRTGFAVPIFPQLRPLLEKRLALVGGNPSPNTKVFSVFDPKKALTGACERLKLPTYSSRAFRRMFITTAIERGVDVKVLSQWQAHADGGKLLLDTYSHVRPAHSERMAQLMTDEQIAPGNVVRMRGVV